MSSVKTSPGKKPGSKIKHQNPFSVLNVKSFKERIFNLLDVEMIKKENFFFELAENFSS